MQRARPAAGPPRDFFRPCQEDAMFPEYRHVITRLKAEDPHFTALFQRHNELDQEIQNMEAGIVPASSGNIENLKKEKLRLKDKLYDILRAADRDSS
ncbi:PF04325 family protein [Bordetella bronchiseptica E014]|nr:PF04325 family protein [Bordetella bronchiseptica E014]KDC88197.1 PF04325 family protein [Bordetella bronchiseptica MBORD665]KDC89051.1 PF04325 family protein [Bordetella bronchiseptica MBORD668]KDD03035.1 PF04325 family protein [Bordetella bronchiseptica MBORD698]KDD11355.1 PF04325 family protein [Bordetella bronchiseptica MBORD707]KDD25576.1 PF04325 family protein [Bordetella bronchiseptica MBORD782]KDD62140.1 PF04325 family protein [Bordetella bronchiseptica SO10328]KDD99402.1 PF04325 